MFGLRFQAHEVDNIDDAQLEMRQMRAQQVGGSEHLQRGDVPGAGEHDVGVLAPSSPSVLAHGQMPSPRVQCAMASSMFR